MIKSLGSAVPRIEKSAYVSEAAYVVGDVEIGSESSVWPGAVIRGDAGKIQIGEGSNVQDNSVVHADSPAYIGDNVTIGHGVVCHARRIGDNCLIGNGAVINDGAELGDFCLVAAGSTVLENMKVPSNSLLVGTPARIRGHLEERHVEIIKVGAAIYTERISQYKDAGL